MDFRGGKSVAVRRALKRRPRAIWKNGLRLRQAKTEEFAEGFQTPLQPESLPPRQFMSHPKIARVLTRPGVGGAARHVAQLERGLSREFESRIFLGPARRGEGDFWKLFSEFEARRVWISGLQREVSWSKDGRALQLLVRHFRRFRPDLVDTHLSKAGILGRLAARICRIPCLHTFHINIFEGYHWPPVQREFYLRLERVAARWSRKLLVLDDALGAQFLALGIGEKSQFETIRLGVELAPFSLDESHARTSVRSELGLAPDTILVGAISRLAPVKNLRVLLEIAPFFPHVHFVLVGEGETRERLERLARHLGVATRAHFLGLRSDTARLQLAFDCVVLPSFQEGTPVAIIEALAARRAVIASDVGGVRCLVRHQETGLLIAPSSDDLARALKQVLTDRETAKRWGQNGRTLVEREWSLEAMLARHAQIYREILRGSPGNESGE